MKVGDTFLRPARSTQSEKQHLWIVVTDPNTENNVLIVNVTSLKPWQDQTVILNIEWPLPMSHGPRRTECDPRLVPGLILMEEKILDNADATL